jgi:hypothetical protein
VATVDEVSEEPFGQRLWHELRQGARNVAGVRYQLGVTAYLASLSRAGELDFVEFTPEGLEDIDCLDSADVQWHVQVKEVGAGAGSFPLSRMAEVIDHAGRATSSDSRIVAVTDGLLGRGLTETGWEQALAATDAIDLAGLESALDERGWTEQEARSLLGRSHLIRLDWNVSGPTINSLADAFGVPRAVASVIYRALVDDLSEVAADQRTRAENEAARRRVGDLDVLAHRVLEVVDQTTLDEAVARGVCEPADYVALPGFGRRDFLEGIDVSPSHIGASFDVLRPHAIRNVQQAIERRRYALIAGPSGSGKSAQAWRSARDVATGARVLRVTRIADSDDLSLLLRHVRLLEPTQHSPVVVVADDLGRPQTRNWPVATRRLLELSDVLLIGAVRQEDLTADMIRHGGELVTLELDSDTARVIAEQLMYEGIELRLEVEEAIADAGGLLMEYIALLTTGRRLREVLGAQVEDLLNEDQTSIEAARVVCAAHTLGVPIGADELEAELQPAVPADLSKALRRLRDEHIITTSDRSAWRGLHEVRSLELTDLLHTDPPPTLEKTLARAVSLLDPLALGWAIRRAVEQYPSLDFDLRAIASGAVPRCSSASEFAQLFESFERADNSITAQAYVPVLDRHRRPSLTMGAWAMFVLGHKYADISFHGVETLARMARAIAACAADLGERNTGLCDAAARVVSSQQIIDAAIDAPLPEAVRLLDSSSVYVSLTESDLDRLAGRFQRPEATLDHEERQLFGRLMLAASVAAESFAAFVTAFGSAEDRAAWAAAAHPDVVAFDIDVSASTATANLLIRLDDDAGSSPLPWDAARERSYTSDQTNDRAVELATFVGECCPELEVVEVRTVTPVGEPYRIGDLEPGHKRLGRDARRPRHETRVMQGLLAAIGRQMTANSWTELIRLRSAAALDVLATSRELARRLNPNDNPRRRARWCDDLRALDARLAALPRPPTTSQLTPGSMAITWDTDAGEDPLVEVLRKTVGSLQQAVPQQGGRLVPVGLGDQLDKAADQLASVLEGEPPLVATDELDIYQDLVQQLRKARGLLLAVNVDDSVKRRIKGKPEELESVLDQLIERAAEEQLEADRSAVTDLFAPVGRAEVHIAGDDEPFITSIARHQVIVTVPPDLWLDAFATLSDAGQRGAAPTDVPLSLVCIKSGTVLPIGARLSTMFPAGALPLAPDAIEKLAQSLGAPFLADAHTVVMPALERLTAASHAIARARMRPASWPEPPVDTEELLREAEDLIPTGPGTTAVAEPLRRLLQRVRAEESGQTAGCLADEVTGLRLLDGNSDDLGPVWQDVIEASLASIELSLSGDA